jgi:predicted DNA-binding protein (MmcQ/YjbR family)
MTRFKTVAQELRVAAAGYPGAYEESPWGELAVKVKNKIFVFLGRGEGTTFGLSVKLPSSSGLALGFPFASPTGYGLGKSGWVSARFEEDDEVPVGLLVEWIDESYRAIAPKKLIQELDARVPGGAERASGSRDEKKPPPGKSAPRKKGAKKAAILVVGEDALRVARAVKAIGADGLGKAVGSDLSGALAALGKKKPAAVIVDLGRSPGDALEVGVQLAHALGKSPLVFAGARDVKTVKKARAAADAVSAALREPPGDPAVLAALAAALG